MSGTDSIFVAKAKTPQEKDACFAIRNTVFVQEQQDPLDLEMDEFDAMALHFIARKNQEAIGTARVVFKDSGATAKIGRVAVLKPARGSGVGRIIMQTVEADSEVRNAGTFYLEAQTYAVPFYERLGYSPYGEEFMDAGIPHRFMSKQNLTPALPAKN